MSKVFLLPGLGDDYRIFEGIDLQGHEGVHVEWVEPEKQDTLATYSQKLINYYQITPQSIVIGNSLGGMIGVEIAKKLANKTILISSIKTYDENSGKSKIQRLIPFYYPIRSKLVAFIKFLIMPFRGEKSKRKQQLFASMKAHTSSSFFKWAEYAILHWDNQTVPPNIYHINGDHDSVFPAKRIKDAIMIKGGTHTIILDRKEEINALLKEML
ncbi:MAG TPA: alpha/beta hydrolase [Mucilaginibacter sp.]|jgi:pimeloyl-ACP methyl ester carboxylesterase